MTLRSRRSGFWAGSWGRFVAVRSERRKDPGRLRMERHQDPPGVEFFTEPTWVAFRRFRTTNFFDDVSALDRIDWELLRACDFKYSTE